MWKFGAFSYCTFEEKEIMWISVKLSCWIDFDWSPGVESNKSCGHPATVQLMYVFHRLGIVNLFPRPPRRSTLGEGGGGIKKHLVFLRVY